MCLELWGMWRITLGDGIFRVPKAALFDPRPVAAKLDSDSRQEVELERIGGCNQAVEHKSRQRSISVSAAP
jgi:hypothetical protein